MGKKKEKKENSKKKEIVFRPPLGIINLEDLCKELPLHKHNLAGYMGYLAKNQLELVLLPSEYKTIFSYPRSLIKKSGFTVRRGCIWRNKRRISSYLFQPTGIKISCMPNCDNFFSFSLIFYRVRYCRLNNLEYLRKFDFNIDEISSIGVYFISPALLKNNTLSVDPVIQLPFPLDRDAEIIDELKKGLKYIAPDIQYFMKTETLINTLTIEKKLTYRPYKSNGKTYYSSDIIDYFKFSQLDFKMDITELELLLKSFITNNKYQRFVTDINDLSLGWRQIENNYLYFETVDLENIFCNEIEYSKHYSVSNIDFVKRALPIVDCFNKYFNRDSQLSSEYICKNLSSMTTDFEIFIISSLLFSFTKYLFNLNGYETNFLTCISYSADYQGTSFEWDLFFRAMILLNGKGTFEPKGPIQHDPAGKYIFCKASELSMFLSSFPDCLPFLIFNMNGISYLEQELIAAAEDIIVEDINESNPIDITGIIHNELSINGTANKRILLKALISAFRTSFKSRIISADESNDFSHDLFKKFGIILNKYKSVSSIPFHKNDIVKLSRLNVCPILLAPHISGFQNTSGSMISLFLDESNCRPLDISVVSAGIINHQFWALIKDYIKYLEFLANSDTFSIRIKEAYDNAYSEFSPLDIFDNNHQLINNLTCLLASLYSFENFIKNKFPEDSISKLITNSTELLCRLAKDNLKKPSVDICRSFYGFIKSLETSNRIGTIKNPLSPEQLAWRDATDSSLLYLRNSTYYIDFQQYLKNQNIDLKISKKEFQDSVLIAKGLLIPVPMTSKTSYTRYDRAKVISSSEPRVSVLTLKYKELEQMTHDKNIT